MGTDVSGILFYGTPLPDFDEDLDYHDLNDQWERLHQPKQPVDDGKYNSPEWDAWRIAKREWALSAQNIEIRWSGSENCNAYYIHVAGLKIEADWSDQIDITSRLGIPPDAQQWLDQFCDLFKFERVKPAWHLAARYF